MIMTNLIEGADDVANLATGIRWHSRNGISGNGELTAAVGKGVLHLLHLSPVGSTLGTDNSPGPQGSLHEIEVGFLEETDSWANRITAVRDDYIKFAHVVFHEVKAITNGEIQLGRLEATSHEREKLL